MSDRVKEALVMFKDGFPCSQSVFGAYSDMLGLDREYALRIANGFGAGIARRQDVCGAVSGAVMLIGLKYGKVKADDTVAHEKTYSVVNTFIDRFMERNSSINCRELLGCDIPTANTKGLFATLCKKYVTDAAELVEEILMEDEEHG